MTDAIHDLLWMVRATPMCSPKLLELVDASDPARLIAKSDLLHTKIEGRPRHFFWEMFVRSIGRPDLAVDRGLVFDTQQLAAQYAMSGDGIALIDPKLFHEEIRAGRLVAPFDLWIDEGYGYYLDDPSRGSEQRSGGALPLVAHRRFASGRSGDRRPRRSRAGEMRAQDPGGQVAATSAPPKRTESPDVRRPAAGSRPSPTRGASAPPLPRPGRRPSLGCRFRRSSFCPPTKSSRSIRRR